MILLHTLLVLLLSVSFAWSVGNESSNTLPINSSNQVVSPFNATLRTFLNQEDPARHAETFAQDFIVSGGIHGTIASMTSPAFALTGYTSSGNRVVQSSTSINYSTSGCAASDTAWVIFSASTSDNLSNFARVTGTDYFVDCTSTTEPSLPADSGWLMAVEIVSSSINSVQDKRKLSPLLSESNNTFGSATLLQNLEQYLGATLAAFVASDCFPLVPGSGLTIAAFPCTALVKDTSTPPRLIPVVQSSRSITVPNSPTVWIAIHKDLTSTPSGCSAGNWSRESNTHYLTCATTSRPSDPINGLVFSVGTVSGGSITALEAVGLRRFVAPTTTLTVSHTVGLDGSWFVEPGATISLGSGITITYKGGGCDLWPIRTLFSGTGVLRFQTGSCPAVHANWWGTDPTNTNDSQPAIQKAIDSLPSVNGGVVRLFTPGTYKLNSAIILRDGITLDMPVGRQVLLKGALSTALIASVNAATGTRSNLMVVHGGNIDNTARTTAGGIGIDMLNWNASRIEDVIIENVETGIRISGNSTPSGGAYYNELRGVLMSVVRDGYVITTLGNENHIWGGRLTDLTRDGVRIDDNTNCVYTALSIEGFTGAGFHFLTSPPATNHTIISPRLENASVGGIGIDVDQTTSGGHLLLGGRFVNLTTNIDDPNSLVAVHADSTWRTTGGTTVFKHRRLQISINGGTVSANTTTDVNSGAITGLPESASLFVTPNKLTPNGILVTALPASGGGSMYFRFANVTTGSIVVGTLTHTVDIWEH